MSVISATKEAEIRRIMVKDSQEEKLAKPTLKKSRPGVMVINVIPATWEV
jgi:hypothetical protein